MAAGSDPFLPLGSDPVAAQRVLTPALLTGATNRSTLHTPKVSLPSLRRGEGFKRESGEGASRVHSGAAPQR
ncbi:hypothetical protein Smlt0259 [Stenotrophomonas maltophilia K279a]|uniref:Uncharacterized protein n=1 Tax=Stenotrophomonas maltophilia (strain K279a) TaxID=522373 RepID=B2FI75_STRMK|nr:hypothetical protein Smlt0259 [Stenotrophomonas maltophilia K279a]